MQTLKKYNAKSVKHVTYGGLTLARQLLGPKKFLLVSDWMQKV